MSDEIKLNLPVAVDSKVPTMTSDFEQFHIVGAADYQFGAQQILAIKKEIKRLEDERVAKKAAALQFCRDIDGIYQPVIKDAQALIARFDQKMLAHRQAEETKRKAEEAKIAEEQRKAREKLEKEAAKAETAGKSEKADALRQAAVSIPETVQLASTVPKVAGYGTRENWFAVVTDLPALIAACNEQPHLRGTTEAPGALMPNMTWLNAQARLAKKGLQIPGVESKSNEKSTATGR